MSANRKCCVLSCDGKSTSRHRIPHPIADAHDRYWKWLALIQNPSLNTLDPMFVYKSKRICSRHFSPDRFVFGTKKLKRNALPDMHIGECRNVIKDKNGKVRDDTLSLTLNESSKDHCTLQDIDIGGDIDDPVVGGALELATGVSRDSVVIPDESIAGTSRALPSGEETPDSEPSLFQMLSSSDNPQENVADWNAGDNADEDSDRDNEDSIRTEADSPDIVSLFDDRGSTMYHNKGDADVSKEILTEYTKENGLVMFFAKAYQVTKSFPQELQNQIKKEILESIVRAQSKYENGFH